MRQIPEPLKSVVAPLLVDNVDTDTIIPSREMRTTGRTGLADGLFAPWRYTDPDSRTENPEFVLNQARFRDTQIIAGGANFGCGSSREHAVWALAEWGIRAIIAQSFAPIFRNNCVRNGIVPIALPHPAVKTLASQNVIVWLADQAVHGPNETFRFEIDPEAKRMLLEGLDAIDLTLTQADTIARWVDADRKARPWVYLRGLESSGPAREATN